MRKSRGAAMFLPTVAIPVASVYPFQILNQSLKQSNVSVSKAIERSSLGREMRWAAILYRGGTADGIRYVSTRLSPACRFKYMWQDTCRSVYWVSHHALHLGFLLPFKWSGNPHPHSSRARWGCGGVDDMIRGQRWSMLCFQPFFLNHPCCSRDIAHGLRVTAAESGFPAVWRGYSRHHFVCDLPYVGAYNQRTRKGTSSIQMKRLLHIWDVIWLKWLLNLK